MRTLTPVPTLRRPFTRWVSVTAAIILAGAMFLLLTGMGTAPAPEGQREEDTRRQATYDRLSKSQPAADMNYSPTRETKNFWVRTWDEPGKLSYIYVLNAANDVTGYYIFEGLPVSYCTSLVPPYQLVDQAYEAADVMVPAPSVDGTFSSGADCGTKYGKDAVSGTYVEFSVGVGLSYIALDQPLPPARLQHAKPLGFATTEAATKKVAPKKVTTTP